MPTVTRPDVATRDYQLIAYTTLSGDTSTAVQPWPGTDTAHPNNARSPVSGVLVSFPLAGAGAGAAGNVPGTYIEVGGFDTTPGNSPTVLFPGDSVLRPSPTAAAVYIVASVAGLQVRGIVQ